MEKKKETPKIPIQKTDLPPRFLERMHELLKEEYANWLSSYEEEKSQGFRINRLKGTKERFLRFDPFSSVPVPWEEDGFFYPVNMRPGKHPYHEAGVYYIQEPSAMAVGALTGARPGEKILDLCAAPGGKSSHIASCMRGEGLLISNEIHPARAKILSQNIERMGSANVVVTNDSPQNLAKRFPEFFDRIVVDAPCSGEGMFRKEEGARAEWSEEKVALCAQRQQEILDRAAMMLKGGGKLIYSTCTFAPEEDEESVVRFLKNHPEFEVEQIQNAEHYYSCGFSAGRADWVKNECVQGMEESIARTLRLFPHRLKGEGHYIAVFRKKEAENFKRVWPALNGIKEKRQLAEWKVFQENCDFKMQDGMYVLFGTQLYLVPESMPDIKGLKIMRAGLHLGEIKKNRFEPSHALALYLKRNDFHNYIDLRADSQEILAYLRGEPLLMDTKKGWCLIGVDGYSLGWGKAVQGMIKNHYPKGLRWMG